MFMETFAKLGIAGVFTGFSGQHNDIYPVERLLTAKRFSNNAFGAISIKSTFELFFLRLPSRVVALRCRYRGTKVSSTYLHFGDFYQTPAYIVQASALGSHG